MAALSVTFDSQQLNQTSSTTGYLLEEPIDWGSRPIENVVNTGSYRPEELDSVLAAGRVVRVIQLPIRVQGSSADDMNSKIALLNYTLSKSNRYSPTNLVVTPQGSSKTTTFKVVGGALDDTQRWTKKVDNHFIWHGVLILEALPFGYGASQTYGSSGSPLFNAATPGVFTVNVTSGSEGDVPADVTLHVLDASNQYGCLIVGGISGNTSWTAFDNLTAWTHGSGPTFSTAASAKYKNNPATTVTNSNSGTIETALKKTFVAGTDWPHTTGLRIFIAADDTTNTQNLRGQNQFRLKVYPSGLQSETAYGDWCGVPASSLVGGVHELQWVDAGLFTIAPTPVDGSSTFNIVLEIEQQTTNGTPTSVAYDEILFVPDTSHLIGEWVSAYPIAANTQLDVESDMVYSGGAGVSSLLTGPHIRTRGASRYVVYKGKYPMSSMAGDVTYDTVKVWANVTPRYLGLAPV